MDEIERDADGRITLVESASDAKVRTTKSTVRFAYDAPTHLDWCQKKGELKSVDGSWELTDLGNDRTRAVYSLEVELGRMLSLVIRGPLIDVLRGQLVGARGGAQDASRRRLSADRERVRGSGRPPQRPAPLLHGPTLGIKLRRFCDGTRFRYVFY